MTPIHIRSNEEKTRQEEDHSGCKAERLKKMDRGVTLAMISSLVGTADTSGRAFLAPLTKSLPTDLGFLVRSTLGVALHITCYALQC